MDFDFSQEQQMLRDSTERLLADRYDFDARKAHGANERGWSPEIWSALADLGLLALPFAEDDGGIGGGPVETMIVMEAMGAKLTLEPYLAAIVIGGGFLRRAPDAIRNELVEAVSTGQTIVSLAHQERQARYDLFDVATTARPDGEDFIIDGKKSIVLAGDAADHFVVSVRLSGERRDERGIALFLVDARAPGVVRRGFPTQDGRRAAEVEFDGVRVPRSAMIADGEAGFAILSAVLDEALAALCAEAVGVLATIHTQTVEYLKTRKQFGVTIGSFQALQHRAADMYVELEQARSMALFATMMASEPDPAVRSRAISAAKVQIGKAARLLGQEAVQLHGGIGMTMETAVGHYFKRLTMIEMMFGDTHHHLARVASQTRPL